MVNNDIEFLLVEDNPDNEELILFTMRENNTTDRIKVVQDGVEAFHIIFGHYVMNPPRCYWQILNESLGGFR